MSDKEKSILLFVIFITISLVYFFTNTNDINNFIIRNRIIKFISLLLVGYCVAISSTLFQTISNNRIITPSIMGFDSLYIFIQSFIVLVVTNLGDINQYYLEFIISSIAIMSILSRKLYNIVSSISRKTIYLLLLTGVVINLLFKSMGNLLISLMDINKFNLLQQKMYTNFDNMITSSIPIGILVITLCSFIIYNIYNQLDLVLIGRNNAKMLGIDIKNLESAIIGIVSALVCVSTILVGPVIFLGLFVVNISYEIMEYCNHKNMFIFSILISWIALVFSSIITDRIFEFTMTVNVVLDFIGGIYFIGLLLRRNKKYDFNN